MASGSSPAGFHHGLSQPDQALTIRLAHCPAGADWTPVDHWLSAKLGLPIQPRSGSGGSTDDAAETIWRILQLAAELQRAARLPVFEPGRVLSRMPDESMPGAWLFTVAVPQLDHMPAPSLHAVYNAATALILGLAGDPASFAEPERLYAEVESQVLQPLRQALPLGKSSIHLLRTAHELDMPWRHLGNGLFQLGWGRHSHRVRHSKSESDSSLGVDAAQHKYVAAEWLRQFGLPAPTHTLLAEEGQAMQAAAAIGWPVVVKPADRDRGEGVTVGVESEESLRAAFQHASRFSKQVLVERMVPGTCHRLLVVRGRVLYAVRRHPIGVEGDGRSTIAERIQVANARRMALPAWNRPPPYPADDLARQELDRAGLTLDSILAPGAWAPLRRIESTDWGGVDEDFSTTLHPDNAAIAIQAAELFGLDIAGVDIISPDITHPWHENGAVINEVNSSPLLGASQSSLDSLPALMARLVPGDGRIPIEAVAGGDDALRVARARQRYWADRGLACYVASHALTEDPSGHAVPMAAQGLFARCTALLMNKHVDAIVMAVQTDELLETGLPVDRLNRVERVAGKVAAWNAGAITQAAGETEKTLALLLAHSSPLHSRA
ncbi:hypothetical protein [Pollutimonas sp. M17]|uniref:ATP-binding protein n=1 Tax=Pollutimonas sp. M17 TaxID=2962065 RepID=UPI0021F40868|nr:hypothetical protein [Pollutimonas sp. M17]UYO94427.1 hypothetical protein OEG81_03580 [Pollutimonas sp. M17]